MDKLAITIIRARVISEIDFLALCVSKLIEFQTDAEQAAHQTQEENGEGFNKSDAPYFHRWFELHSSGKAVEREVAAGLRYDAAQRVRKYAKQLSTILNYDQINY